MRGLLFGSLVVTSACRTVEPPPVTSATSPAVELDASTPRIDEALAQAAQDPSSLPHARLRKLGRTSLVPDGAPLGSASELSSCQDFELPIVATRGDRVQVAVKSGGTMLAVWVPIAHLATLVTTPAQVRSSPAEPANGVTLRPGAPVREREARGADSQIEMDHLAERLTGWIPTSALGVMYLPEPPVAPPQHKVWITNGHPLRARPELTAPSTFSSGFGGPYELAGVADGFAELVYRSTFVEARGFVSSSVLNQMTPTGMCERQGSRSLVGQLHSSRTTYVGPIEIPTGTCMRSGANGPIIALQHATATHEIAIAGERWGEVRIDDAWGGHIVSLAVIRTPDGTYAVAPRSCE